ncbi:MAG: AtpZ/AtpI family protein [Alphaproteobacteria bacterium]
MKDDIKKVQERIDALKTPEIKENSTGFRRTDLGFRIVVELISGVVVGAGIGYFLDDCFNVKPLLLIIFLIFGAMAGILNVYRIAKREVNRG